MIPWLGAKNSALVKINPATTAIIPEVEVDSRPNQWGNINALKCPKTADSIAKITLRNTIMVNLSVSK